MIYKKVKFSVGYKMGKVTFSCVRFVCFKKAYKTRRLIVRQRSHRQGPLPLGIQIADVAGGSILLVTGILAVVIERNQSGEGQA
jgi:hypothetical protein